MFRKRYQKIFFPFFIRKRSDKVCRKKNLIPSQSNKSLKNSWWNILLYWNALKFAIYLWKIWKKLCLTKYVILLKVHNPLHNRYIYFFFRSNLLDATLIHPESYELAEWLLTSQGFSTKDIGTQNLRNHFLNQIDIKAVKKAMVDENIYSESKSQEKKTFFMAPFSI